MAPSSRPTNRWVDLEEHPSSTSGLRTCTTRCTEVKTRADRGRSRWVPGVGGIGRRSIVVDTREQSALLRGAIPRLSGWERLCTRFLTPWVPCPTPCARGRKGGYTQEQGTLHPGATSSPPGYRQRSSREENASLLGSNARRSRSQAWCSRVPSTMLHGPEHVAPGSEAHCSRVPAMILLGPEHDAPRSWAHCSGAPSTLPPGPEHTAPASRALCCRVPSSTL